MPAEPIDSVIQAAQWALCRLVEEQTFAADQALAEKGYREKHGDKAH